MRIFLVWTLFPGGWAVTGPTQVTAKQGDSLTVSCSYKPGYELYPKYWCRPGFLWFCFTDIVQTNGSEVTVTQGGVSIRDNHRARSFTVTLGGVTPRDAGWYSCGVKKRLWFNLWHSTEVTVSAADSTVTKPSDVHALATKPLCSADCEKLSQLSITHLLLFLSVKVPMVLALACGVVWVKSRCRTRDGENLQPFEVTGSTGAPGSPPTPTTPEPQGHPPVPLPPTLPGLCYPSRTPRAGNCWAPGASPSVKPRPLLEAPVLERGGSGAQRACVC
ncbi:CMRF35-like molecule 7 [Rissa tridactyla]|uniref:CMRF35-like molecule 7 n=1 Tax=Rissa tridactyla TaxID=75485 RepID=UPI0023BAB6D8|nr:CMRF35-like molecule 7 [Rissa tridactyla]